jgi:hypothetical protein
VTLVVLSNDEIYHLDGRESEEIGRKLRETVELYK